QKALTHYQDGLTISQRRADADPKDARAQRDLSVSHNNLGDVLLQQGEGQKALMHYQEYHKISQRLADADPNDAKAQTDLVISHYKLGRTQMQALRHQEAAASFEKGLARLRSWQQEGKLKGTKFASWPGIVEGELRAAQDALKALGDLEALLKSAPK